MSDNKLSICYQLNLNLQVKTLLQKVERADPRTNKPVSIFNRLLLKNKYTWKSFNIHF